MKTNHHVQLVLNSGGKAFDSLCRSSNCEESIEGEGAQESPPHLEVGCGNIGAWQRWGGEQVKAGSSMEGDTRFLKENNLPLESLCVLVTIPEGKKWNTDVQKWDSALNNYDLSWISFRLGTSLLSDKNHAVTGYSCYPSTEVSLFIRDQWRSVLRIGLVLVITMISWGCWVFRLHLSKCSLHSKSFLSKVKFQRVAMLACSGKN